MGRLFVIESGSDASGKATQTELLYNRLLMDGYNVRKVEYPNYNSESSALVKMYLKGDFGSNPEDVNPYITSTFYAIDRYASYKTKWEEFYKSVGIIIADIYTTSNMVHQAAKYENYEDKDKFLKWLAEYEFDFYGLPRPSEVFFLNMSVDFSLNLMKNRKNKITGNAKKDIHEANEAYLRKSYENALYVAKKYDWKNIECTKDSSLRTIKDIHEEIYSLIVETLKTGEDGNYFGKR